MTKKRTQVGECDFEGCTNAKVTRGVCSGHYNHLRRGIELMPLRQYADKPKKVTQPRRVYTDEDVCMHDSCEERPVVKEMCKKHYWQFNQYGYTFDGRKEAVAVEVIVSETERYCPDCKRTVNWRGYYLDQKKCRECYREWLNRDTNPPPHHSKKKTDNMAELMDFLASV